jgi:hypothetical protein
MRCSVLGTNRFSEELTPLTATSVALIDAMQWGCVIEPSQALEEYPAPRFPGVGLVLLGGGQCMAPPFRGIDLVAVVDHVDTPLLAGRAGVKISRMAGTGTTREQSPRIFHGSSCAFRASFRIELPIRFFWV